jgi:preprotein translocase subunit YajC
MGLGSPDILFMLGAILVMYFLFFRPQQQQRKALNKMLAALKRGDQVVTTAGMRGEVVAVEDKIVTIKFHGDTRIDFDKSAIAQVVEEKKEA